VIIDIFRATTAICAAFSNQIKTIIPVKTIEEALKYRGNDYILASERHGKKIEGFDLGNSPEGFLDPSLRNKTIVLSTTNGTNAILSASGADIIMIGSFLNISAITQKLIHINKDIILLCAGWQDKFNLEDTVFAGALTEILAVGFDISQDDSAFCALQLYQFAKNDMKSFLLKSSHYNRLKHLNLEADILFSLKIDETHIVPYFDGYAIIC